MEEKIKELEKRIEQLETRRIGQKELLPQAIHQRNIFEGLIVFRGATADKPTDGSTEVQCFFDETVNKLYIWDTGSESWLGVTLS